MYFSEVKVVLTQFPTALLHQGPLRLLFLALCVLGWTLHDFVSTANAGLVPLEHRRSCDQDAIGQELLDGRLRLDGAMEQGDWRTARRTIEELLPLIEASMPDVPVVPDATDAADVPQDEPLKLSRDCVTDTLHVIAKLFVNLSMTEPAEAATQAAINYVQSMHFDGPDETDIANQRKGAAAFRRMLQMVQQLDASEAAGSAKRMSVWHELTKKPLRFTTQAASPAECGSHNDGKVRALLVGKAKVLTFDLNGPQNDVQLIRTTLEQRGVDPRDIVLLEDDEAQRGDVVSAMQKTVEQTQCSDFVLFYYSGGGAGVTNLPGLRSVLLLGHAGLVRPNNDAVLWGHEISEFITAINNRKASVVVFLDMNEASGLDVGIHQQLAGSKPDENWTGETVEFQKLLRTAGIDVSVTPLTEGNGDYAIFYAAKPGETVPEGLPFQDDTSDGPKNYGIFTYAFATALQSLERPTIRQLTRALAASFAKLSVGHAMTPVFETSDPDMEFLGTGRPGDLGVEIMEPKALRGAMVIESEEEVFTLIGRLTNPKEARVLTVNNEQVDFDESGRFEAVITLVAGENRITIGTTNARDRYQKKTISFTYKGNLKRFIAQGTRYALVIGNEDYIDDDVFPDLSTPHEDAEAVANLLSEKFGFRTEIEVSGKRHPLVLKDAGRDDINKALTLLRRGLTKHDVLMIYYAGHGEIIEETGDAFWVPVDGRHDEDTSWLSSDDLRRALKRMKARSVLIVADSCFAGGMDRSPRELKYFDPSNRERALKKAAELQSRVFMTSGGEEPVQDVDRLDAGHSPFAGAFLRGLTTIEHDVFSTRELFDLVYNYVYGNNPQEPQFKQLRDSGHLGGDFVFTRVTSTTGGN